MDRFGFGQIISPQKWLVQSQNRPSGWAHWYPMTAYDSLFLCEASSQVKWWSSARPKSCCEATAPFQLWCRVLEINLVKCMKMRAKKRSSACKFYIPFLLLFLRFFSCPPRWNTPKGLLRRAIVEPRNSTSMREMDERRCPNFIQVPRMYL